ncbi:hypothetical protein V5O48_003653 [Marasmius crinis-equi]|uniref:Alpha/beta hydrolase fold-3 domain-containing protein n=1 Tax=Marasmius crinis-equi TaxID=585013 RepID=A0ABR3FT33_9AGAR
MAEYMHLSIIDPEFAPIAASLPPPPPVVEIPTLRRNYEQWMLPAIETAFGPSLPPGKCLPLVRANPHLFSADLSKGFLVGGVSAGGNLAAVLAHLARDDPEFNDTPLTGHFLEHPSLIRAGAYPEQFKSSLLSAERNIDDPILTPATRKALGDAYNPVPTDPKASPLLFPSHKGLPAAYLQICGMDPVRDEAFLYEKILKAEGVPTKFDIYPGLPHGFVGVAPQITQGKKYIQDFGLGVGWLLKQGKD